jgi:hypothetical protein
MEQQAGHHHALPMDRLAAEHRSIQGTKPFFISYFSIKQIINRSSNSLPPFDLFLPTI